MAVSDVLINYTNWRGERRWRQVRPIRIAYEKSKWHSQTQWIMHAFDCETETNREFSMMNIHEWKPF